MRTNKQFYESIILTALLFAGFSAGGMAQDKSNIVEPETKAPAILATSPADGEMNVSRNSVIEITFNSEMDAASINTTTLLLHETYADTMYEEHGEMLNDQIRDRSANKDTENRWQYSSGAVNGTISYSNKIAVFTPDRELKEGALYTFTVTNGVKDLENIALENGHSWSFTTTGTSDASYSDKQNDKQGMKMKGNENRPMHAMSTKKMKSIDLGKAGQFVILAKTSVINNSASRVTGHIGEGYVTKSLKKENN